jgi:UDP-glucose:(glucosyl)LPS alpha-1,3-glucosyltransferase/UDP-D-galactose:(glucosyl)LPS alpha-1,3-D-galactosyltransferase/UDP-glucose:(galactosyl)LPS alpha-1,2-glucosyltransferase
MSNVSIAALLEHKRFYQSFPVPAPSREAATFHVVFGVDQAFLSHAAIAMQSIIERERDLSFHFHFISTADLSGALANLQTIIAESRCQATFHRIADQLFENLPQSTLFPKSIYYRLLAPFILEEYQQVVYLDADIVCLAPLSPIWRQLEATDCVAAVVRDSPLAEQSRTASLGMTCEQYFNSGVMLIDIRAWHRERVTEQVLEVIEQRAAELKWPDQDALNVVLQERAHFIDARFNTQFKLGHGRDDHQRPVPPETVLLHYAGANKPWQIWNTQAATLHYREVRARSPWRDTPFDVPSTSKHAKRMYKSCFLDNKPLKGVYWFLCYRFKW